MDVDVLIFGAAAMIAGRNRVTVRVHGSPTVADVASALAVQHPELRFALSPPRLAVNHAFAGPEARITEGDEVALITLVGGG